MANERTDVFKAPPLARISYAQDLLKARPNDKGVLKYGCALIWPKSADIAILMQAVRDVATKQWGDKAVQMLKDGAIKHPILDGDGPQGLKKETGERYPYLVGAWFIRPTANESSPPRVVNRKVLPVTEIGDEFYSGCYVHAMLNAFCWANDKNGKGVSFGIMAVQVAKDGEKLASAGGIDPSKHFETIADEGSEAIEAAKKGQDGAASLFA